MFKYFFIFYFLFCVSTKKVKSYKIINLSDYSLYDDIGSSLNENDSFYIKKLIEFIEKNVEKKQNKKKDDIIKQYLSELVFLGNENFFEKDFLHQASDKKLDFFFNKIFFFLFKLSFKFKYILNFKDIKLDYDLQYLSKLLNILLDCTNKSSECFFLNDSIIYLIEKKDNLIYNLENTKSQDYKYCIFKNFLENCFHVIQKYFCKYFEEILPFIGGSDEKFLIDNNLHFLEIYSNDNLNIEILDQYSFCFDNLRDPLIFIEFYTKQIKYFLNNLIFLSIFKKNDMNFSNVDDEFYNKTFYENLQNFFNFSCLSFYAAGQHVRYSNLDEFLGIKTTGNFFNYKNDLKFSDVENFSFFFLNLVEVYDKNISILNFNEFNIDNFIKFITKKNGYINCPKEIITILNFIFSYDSYCSDVNLNKEEFLDNSEKKGKFEFEIDENLKNINEFNSDLSKINDFDTKKKEEFCKKNAKQLKKSLSIEHKMFFRFDKLSFDFFNKKCYIGIGYKIKKENFSLGVKIFFDVNYFYFSIAYFFKDNIVFSIFVNFYKNFFLSFSFSNDKNMSFNIGCFLNIKDIILDIDLSICF